MSVDAVTVRENSVCSAIRGCDGVRALKHDCKFAFTVDCGGGLIFIAELVRLAYRRVFERQRRTIPPDVIVVLVSVSSCDVSIAVVNGVIGFIRAAVQPHAADIEVGTDRRLGVGA